MIRGFVEVVRPFQIRGWALLTDRPGEPLEIQASVAGRPVGSGLADMARSDLTAVGSGDGRHGFVFNLAHALSPLEQAQVSVHARDEMGRAVELRRLVANVPSVPTPSKTASARSQILRRYEVEDRTHRPIFILGSARSGTSALAQGLLGTTRYKGHEEGHLLDIAIELSRTISQHYEKRGEEWSERPTMIAEVPETLLQDWRRHLFVDLARHLFPEGRWLDKTPRATMTAAAADLREIWPNARFIYMRRRGLENIQSRLTKFPLISFEMHCADWERSLSEWVRVRPFLTGAAIEIDQYLLAREPDRVAAELSPFLDLTEQEAARLAGALRNERPERTSANFGSAASIETVGWTPEQRTTFHSICGPMMRAFAYSETESYFLEGASSSVLLRF